MTELTKDELKVIEAMARAACEVDGTDPDKEMVLHEQSPAEDFMGSAFFGPAWQNYVGAARRQYVAYKAMMEARYGP
jgi:hypothetical protein